VCFILRDAQQRRFELDYFCVPGYQYEKNLQADINPRLRLNPSIARISMKLQTDMKFLTLPVYQYVKKREQSEIKSFNYQDIIKIAD
jgi:hypothetical protein